MDPDYDQHNAEFLAFQETISNSIVGIAIDGPDPGIGTGTLVKWKGKRLLLTANHNLDGTTPDCLRLLFRPPGNIKVAAMAEAAATYGLSPSPGIRAPLKREFCADLANDIALLEFLPHGTVPSPSIFYALDDFPAFSIPDGTSIIVMGFPSDNSVRIPGGRVVGPAADHVRYDSSLNSLSGLPSSYNPNSQYLLRYSRLQDGIHPRGFSGAGAWCNADVDGPVWHSNPRLAGMVVRYHAPNNVLFITGLNAILELASRI